MTNDEKIKIAKEAIRKGLVPIDPFFLTRLEDLQNTVKEILQEVPGYVREHNFIVSVGFEITPVGTLTILLDGRYIVEVARGCYSLAWLQDLLYKQHVPIVDMSKGAMAAEIVKGLAEHQWFQTLMVEEREMDPQLEAWVLDILGDDRMRYHRSMAADWLRNSLSEYRRSKAAFPEEEIWFAGRDY